ncbi:vWA domain-containing protein [Crocinitomix catalasitica]|uniref:vWA domain-containing protein n=1 Tax=Crocinitomix catalasitica TaxID=184607 RepID=UPI00090770FC|nr:VWA domain-containing protein [Crocinitomix catalasitica]
MTDIDLFDIALFDYEYVYKNFLWLLLIIPLLVFWYLYRENSRKNFKNINISTLDGFETNQFNWVQLLRHLNFFLVLFAIAFIIIALARPHDVNDIESYKKKNIEGIDIVLALDVSGSMLAQDFKPNRLEASKRVALDFIRERPTDRIGLVLYEGEAYTKVPLTNDHRILVDAFNTIESGEVAPGTAIGLGLVTAINRLETSTAKSKVIILLTDGVNNVGDIDPITAAQIAKEYGIRVYTIGVGKEGLAPFPVQSPFGVVMQNMPVEIDEDLLMEIAELTGTRYFRAKNQDELLEIYNEIDQLEKSKVKVLEFKTDPPEKYYAILFWAIAALLLSTLMNYTLLKSIP